MSAYPDYSLSGDRSNKYETTFFHMYLDGETPVTLQGYREIDKRDHASFIHEYTHYIQQITTPYGLMHSRYFVTRLCLFREAVAGQSNSKLPVIIDEDIPWLQEFKKELRDKNGDKHFAKCYVGDVELADNDFSQAKENGTAVNIGVYDFENQRVFAEGFKFGFICVMESMAHLIQLLINPEVYHSEVPYQAAQLLCKALRPDLLADTRLLISICYAALYFDNPGVAFVEILRVAKKGENGVELFRRYTCDFSRTFRGEAMPNYRMMHIMMNEFKDQWEVLIGQPLVYMKYMLENCKYEAKAGKSVLLNFIYNGNLNSLETLAELLDFYGIPAIDAIGSDLIIPNDPATGHFYLETGALLSLEVIYHRFTGHEELCLRHPICDRISREKTKVLIDEHCAGTQWEKQISCLFTGGLKYWRMSDKTIIDADQSDRISQ